MELGTPGGLEASQTVGKACPLLSPAPLLAELGKDTVAQSGAGQFIGAVGSWIGRYKDGLPVSREAGPPVRSAHQGGIERDDVQKGTLAQAAFKKFPGDAELGQAQGGVEEEFDRVVAGLAVNIDGAGEVGGLAVVEPVRVGEPGVGLGDQNELAGAWVVEVKLGSLVGHEGSFDARKRCQQVADAGQVG